VDRRHGTGRRNYNHERFALARYRSNGSLDGSFSGEGKMTTAFSPWAAPSALAIDSRDRIVVGGVLGHYTFILARYIGYS
jgi:hypothetical protein